MTTPDMHMDCDGVADALADYLEGDAPDGVRSSVEAHADACASCRQLLADVSAIRADAAALPLLVPSRDLWTGIAERIEAPVLSMESPVTRVTRRAWLRPALAAAALVGITAGVTHYATRVSLPLPAVGQQASTRPAAAPVAVASAPEATGQIASTVTASPVTPASRPVSPSVARLASAERATDAADPVFASEITKLRGIVRDRRAQLDPTTVAVLEQSIAVMDSAIAQSRAALAHDPASGFLATQLNHSLEKKVELLRTAALLPTRL
ncbi:hypothetical protein BH11GEM1_BH11GEM1_16790 [soil metagenome]